MKNSLKKIYHYLFTDLEEQELRTNQYPAEMHELLVQALQTQHFVLVTLSDGTCTIGQINQQLAADKFLLRSANHQLLRIITLKELRHVDLA